MKGTRLWLSSHPVQRHHVPSGPEAGKADFHHWSAARYSRSWHGEARYCRWGFMSVMPCRKYSRKFRKVSGRTGCISSGNEIPATSAVLIYSLNGSRFNRVLAIVLQKRLGGKAQVRYNDFIVRITGAGRTGATERIVAELQTIRTLDRHEFGALLPPSASGQLEIWTAAPCTYVLRIGVVGLLPYRGVYGRDGRNGD